MPLCLPGLSLQGLEELGSILHISITPLSHPTHTGQLLSLRWPKVNVGVQTGTAPPAAAQDLGTAHERG